MIRKFLFWNIKNNNISNVLIELIEEFDLDIIALAEIDPAGRTIILNQINAISAKNQYVEIQTVSILCFFQKISFHNTKEIFTPVTNRYSFLNFSNGTEDFLFAYAHMPSKMYKSISDQLNDQGELARNIIDFEKRLNIKNTLICGDLNINPFEDGLINAQGINSVRCTKVAYRGLKRSGIKIDYFYNPSWKLLVNENGEAAGTYYYQNGDFIHYWNVYDQVLMRPNLISKFNYSSFKAIEKTKSFSLLSQKKRPDPDFSDHLPIVFEFNI